MSTITTVDDCRLDDQISISGGYGGFSPHHHVQTDLQPTQPPIQLVQGFFSRRIKLTIQLFFEKLIFTQLFNKFRFFMEPERSLPLSQEPITGSYPDTDKYSPHCHTILR
jgi:hypothetical protein